MKDLTNINTIDELHKRRRKVELQMQVTQREFAHSMGMMNSSVQNVLFKRVALPLGAAGLGYIVLKKLFSSSNRPVVKLEERQVEQIKNSVTESSAATTTTNVKNTSQPTNKATVNRTAAKKRPTVVKQKVVKQPKNFKMKRWLPVAIQLAKTGYSYYKNHIANPTSADNPRAAAVTRNFLQPKTTNHGNPYDRIPEIVE